MSEATVAYGLQRYGARMKLEDCLRELGVSERTFRERMATGLYPKSVERGRWPTETIMRCAAGDRIETGMEAYDPFAVD